MSDGPTDKVFRGLLEATRYGQLEYITRTLKHYAAMYDVADIANSLIDSEDFRVWSASSRPNTHHYGKHGLIVHTYEVITIALSNATCVEHFNTDMRYTEVRPNIDLRKAVFLAALFHDCGKIHDYAYDEKTDSWSGTMHKKLIHHITTSTQVFLRAATNRLPAALIDEVVHAILAHHGQRQYGSPVEPHTSVAWLLHTADLLSARSDEANTYGITN
jgi:3'-5' exoribonuclease